MSVVTNLIFSFSSLEDEEKVMKQVNEFYYNGLQLNLISVDHNKDTENRTVWYGGTKFLEAKLYLGAFNHFNLNDFIAHLKQIDWEEPDLVQLIIKEQEDMKFRIIDLVEDD